MKKITILLTFILAAISVSAQDDDVQKYEGMIGEFKVTMVYKTLEEFQYTEVGDSVGYYYYNDRPKTKFTLKLKKYETKEIPDFSSFHLSYHIILDEYTPKGFKSGTFDGWTQSYNNYAGTFTNSQCKEYDFSIDINWD